MSDGQGTVLGLALSHRRASVGALQAARYGSPSEVYADLLAEPGVSEAFYLATCNRVEVYVVAGDAGDGRRALSETQLGAREESRWLDHDESLERLLRVAAGVESMVVGEDEILGQVTDAYERARDLDAIGPVLETVVAKAIRVGKRARTETAINEGSRSVATAAVEYLRRRSDLEGETALVVGTGPMGRAVARSLSETGISRLLVANRTAERAAEVCAEVGGIETTAFPLHELKPALREASVAVTATGSEEAVVDADVVTDCGETLLVDVAQPRDVDPAVRSVPDCTVCDLDDVESITDSARARRRDAAERVSELVAGELESLRAQLRKQRADDVIARLHSEAERTKAAELDAAMTKLDAEDGLSAEQREIVESLADAIVSRLLADPTKRLRRAAASDDWEDVRRIERLFLDPESDRVPQRERSPETPSEARLASSVDD